MKNINLNYFLIMKRFITILLLPLLVIFVAIAQNYTREVCSYCNGSRAVFSGYYDYNGNPVFVPCQNCYGTGFVLVPTSSNSPSFQATRLVTFYSKSGGVKYATGTFYELKKQVLCNGNCWSVSDSDSSSWRYMIRFNNGTNWYFD